RHEHPESSATHGSQLHRRRHAVRPDRRQRHDHFRPGHPCPTEFPGPDPPVVLGFSEAPPPGAVSELKTENRLVNNENCRWKNRQNFGFSKANSQYSLINFQFSPVGLALPCTMTIIRSTERHN